jgi:hypothetical protein
VKYICLLDYSNSRGAADMGLMPELLPGYRPSEQAGLRVDEMLDANLDALWVVGANPYKKPGAGGQGPGAGGQGPGAGIDPSRAVDWVRLVNGACGFILLGLERDWVRFANGSSGLILSGLGWEMGSFRQQIVRPHFVGVGPGNGFVSHFCLARRELVGRRGRGPIRVCRVVTWSPIPG